MLTASRVLQRSMRLRASSRQSTLTRSVGLPCARYYSVKSRPLSTNSFHRHTPWGVGLATVISFALLAASSPILLESGQVADDYYTDPETDIAFPPKLKVASKVDLPTLTFLGAGVRRVSILQVKVYSVGIYADLSNPKLKITQEMTSEAKLAHIVQNSACVIRIVPTRTTSYSHLRDAFMRNLQQRLVKAKKDGRLSEQDEQEVQGPLRKLKSLFPSTSIEKHQNFDIFLPQPSPDRARSLVFRDLGAVESDWITTEFIMSYVDGLSPALKKEMLSRAGRM